jgi:hypothetical protein
MSSEHRHAPELNPVGEQYVTPDADGPEPEDDAKVALVESLLRDWDDNSWEASEDAATIAASTWAVIVRSEDHSWVLAANDATDLARIVLGCENDELIHAIVVVANGDYVQYAATVTVSVAIRAPDGHVALGVASG